MTEEGAGGLRQQHPTPRLACSDSELTLSLCQTVASRISQRRAKQDFGSSKREHTQRKVKCVMPAYVTGASPGDAGCTVALYIWTFSSVNDWRRQR